MKVKKPQVEITGWEAKFYDRFLQMISLGKYRPFIRKVILDLRLKSHEIVLDLGAGTGKNAELILESLDEQSRIYAMEIGEEMRRQLIARQISDPRIYILNQRIEEPFVLPEKVSMAFISFVLHGLKFSDRLAVVKNVNHNLVQGGRFCILDYNHFEVNASPWYVKFGVRTVECPTTEDFINQDLPSILAENGFTDCRVYTYFKGYLRLLCCHKR